MKFATIVGYFPFRQTKQPETSGIIKRKWNDIFMHQSIPAAPSPPPPGLLWGICPPCQSRGWGICKCCAARGPGICQPRGQPRAFDTHAVSYQNITTQRILLEKQADWLICQGREKTEEVCKGMFSILCMHFFIAYQARIACRNRELSRREPMFFS